MKEHLFDKRVVQRALQEGLIDQAAYQRMLDALPDLSHKLQSASSSVHAADEAFDDDDEDDEDDIDDAEDAEDAEDGEESEDEPINAPTFSTDV